MPTRKQKETFIYEKALAVLESKGRVKDDGVAFQYTIRQAPLRRHLEGLLSIDPILSKDRLSAFVDLALSGFRAELGLVLDQAAAVLLIEAMGRVRRLITGDEDTSALRELLVKLNDDVAKRYDDLKGTAGRKPVTATYCAAFRFYESQTEFHVQKGKSLEVAQGIANKDTKKEFKFKTDETLKRAKKVGKRIVEKERAEGGINYRLDY